MLFSGSIQRYKHATELTWLGYASKEPAGGKQVVLAAVQLDGPALEYASASMGKQGAAGAQGGRAGC